MSLSKGKINRKFQALPASTKEKFLCSKHRKFSLPLASSFSPGHTCSILPEKLQGVVGDEQGTTGSPLARGLPGPNSVLLLSHLSLSSPVAASGCIGLGSTLPGEDWQSLHSPSGVPLPRPNCHEMFLGLARRVHLVMQPSANTAAAECWRKAPIITMCDNKKIKRPPAM